MVPDVASPPLPAHARGGGGAGQFHRAKQSPVCRARRGQRGRAQQVVFAGDERRVQHLGRVQRVDLARRSQRRHAAFSDNCKIGRQRAGRCGVEELLLAGVPPAFRRHAFLSHL